MSQYKKGISPAWPISIVVLVIVILVVLQIYIDHKNKLAQETANLTAQNQLQDQNDLSALENASSTQQEEGQLGNQANNQINNQNMETSNAQLQITDIVKGTGAEAKSGSKITVNYLGTLTNGQKFDSSYDRGQPFSFTLGQGQVIAGWEQGFSGMKVGGKRKLIIPPAMAYGDRALPTIPANSTLVFEVELVDVK